MRRGAALLIVLIVAAVLAARPAFSATALTESGSTLLYPLLNVWVESYTREHADVQIETRATGSGAGIADAAAGTVTFAASDAPATDAQLGSGLINMPLVVSAQQVNYNVPEAREPVHLSGSALARIYAGDIKTWDDNRLTALNPGVPLPHHAIVPIHRADSSGDTFIFTEYLALADPAWKARYGFAKSMHWPANEMGAKGNAGMIEMCAETPYSVAYVGISFYEQAKARGLGAAALRNRDGNDVQPTAGTIAAATRQAERLTDRDGRASLVYLPGRETYPIVNYEYAIFRKPHDVETARALGGFLSWILRDGSTQTFLAPVHFQPLPDAVAAQSLRRISAAGL